ncbi:peptide deformylase [Streptococcus sp. zg-86]|uniref:Peptide deformylase n=1 Tax=Streptococcus zhangguiae TaxID=2664091 RepID=A0A6I4RIH0_9STRE|nr:MULTISPECIES: peptide deformylase [unclassified Streptococcus]MTB64402.1 peptide deformylase [Streptococcus sp. zg-86]MTB90712.1 peptide deformylase [Streptococcus sp. zg-36]MWV56293.1 peptide deformylase [Streptococcus sp. zg-70]QTH47490.1 peptide deformylase [Streptococcus sp. zg-86]
MIRPIMKDILFLQVPSEPATKADLAIGQDLQDTLLAHQDACVGMAANMIGVRKRIIIVNMGFTNLVMYNPVLEAARRPYQTEESCLSLEGVRTTKRYEEIEVSFFDQNWQVKRLTLTGFTAQIVQHELDHLEGIII